MKRFLSSCARLSHFAISISLGLTALAPLGHTAAHAGTIYSLSNSLSGTSVQNGWTISGSIELQDATAFGAITTSDINSWSWTATQPGSDPLSLSNGSVSVNGQITATATGLYVGTSSNDSFTLNDNSNIYLIWDSYYGAFSLYNFGANPFTIVNATPMDFPVDATYGYQIATTAVALPEPSTYAMALAGLTCGGYLVRRRRRAC